MAFTDEEILLLLDLDLDLADVAAPTRWARACGLLWWAAVTVGSLVGMYAALQADYGFHPSGFPG